jgi:hypothetical protein
LAEHFEGRRRERYRIATKIRELGKVLFCGRSAIASAKGTDLSDRGLGFAFREEANVNPKGAVFQPELIELMKSVLEEATAALPEPKRTSAIKAEMASTILACAAKGEMNPVTLKMCALTAVDVPHYCHDIAPERRAV